MATVKLNPPEESEPVNCDRDNCCGFRLWGYGIAVIGTFLIMGVLVWAMIRYTTPPPVGTQRAEERKKNLADQKAAEAAALEGYAWQDKEKGFVRVPLERAMELVVQEWRNPAEARAQLIKRVEEATAVPPPPPEEPSPFE